MPVQVFHGSQVINSHYINRLRVVIGADIHRDIAWHSFKMVAQHTLANQAVSSSILLHNWLNLGSQRGKFVRDDDSPQVKQCPYGQAGGDFCHLLTCSYSGTLKTLYDATDTLHKAVKCNAAGPSILKAIRYWTNDPRQPPTLNQC